MLIRRLPSLPDWTSSFRELDDVRRDMERIFDAMGRFDISGATGVYPAANVFETDGAILVRAELPGIKTDELEVTVEGNTLTLAGRRDIADESDTASYHRRERGWGSFRRSLSIPVKVDAEKVQARYADGILTIELPKAAEARPRQITVQAGA